MFLVGIAALIGAFALWFLAPFAYRRRQEAALAKACRTAGAIVLSYDDGPGPELTPQLLDLLAARGARATFFCLGDHTEGQRPLVERLLRDGHELGSHTYHHTNAWKAGPLRAARDFKAGARTIQALGGDGALFRPPYGKLTLAGWLHGRAKGLRFGWWTIDTRDSWAPRPVDDILAEIDRENGGVVLMHDWDDYGEAAPKPAHISSTLALTERILDLASRKGLAVRTLGEVLRDAEATAR